MTLTSAEKERYDRQIKIPFFGYEAQLKLKKASVLVIGAGGLGCPALLYLTAAGIGKIGIVDGDQIAFSNLHRQILFDEQDINKNKSEVAQTKLLAKNKEIEIKAYPQFINAENGLELCKNYDLIIDASDNFKTRYLLNDISIITNKPLVYASLFQFEGQITVFNYKNGPTLRCLFPNEPEAGVINNCAEAGVLGVLCGMIGAWQAQEAIKIITEIGEVLSGKLLVYNSLNNEINTLSFKAMESNKQIADLQHHLDKQPLVRKEINFETLKIWQFDNELQLIDVREIYEWNKLNIGGINIPLNTLREQLTLINIKQKVVFICQSGKRSALAYDIFIDNFPNAEIYHLKNGLNSYLL